MQSRRSSIVEISSNYLTGFFVAWLSTPFIMALFGYQATMDRAFGLTICFTVVSFVRSYLFRRLFNYFESKRSQHDSFDKF